MSDKWIGRDEIAEILSQFFNATDIFKQTRAAAERFDLPLDESNQGRKRRVYFKEEQVRRLAGALERHEREILAGPGEDWIDSAEIAQILGYKRANSALSNVRRMSERYDYRPLLDEKVFEGRIYMRRGQIQEWGKWREGLKKDENKRKKPTQASIDRQSYNRPDDPSKSRAILSEKRWNQIHVKGRKRQVRQLLEDSPDPELTRRVFLSLAPRITGNDEEPFLTEEEVALVDEIFDRTLESVLS